MSEEANDKRNGSRREIARRSSEGAIDARQIDAFVENYPLLSLGFVLAAGYALGRIISKH
jgi:hypothetical protein